MKIKFFKDIYIDLDKLIESRLLVQANSGGGKSWTIRWLIEHIFGKKQIIVIDPEGEFGNLRSEFDFVYVGKGGDAPAESRSAALLAHRLLELGASAIIDLYELPPQERKHFVKLFFEALVNAPKELWHDVLVVLDEAHVFAPEKDQSESLGAVIDLASRGRKRGFCLVPATQRPAKLNKDVAAECNNKLIGRASLDIDRKRASEELGFTTREQILSLRDLQPGEFYAFGPAISRDVTKVVVGELKVKPAKRGASKQSVPAPSAKIKKILGQLADIPAEAKREAQTVAELKAENALLKRQGTQVTPNKIEMAKALAERDQQWRLVVADLQRKIEILIENLMKIGHATQKVQELMQKIGDMAHIEIKLKPKKSLTPPAAVAKPIPQKAPVTATESVPSNSSDLTGPEQRILDAIALSESIGIMDPEQTAVAFLAGYTYGGGGFNNPRGALKTKGMLEYRGSKIALTESGRAVAQQPDALLTGEELRSRVMGILPGPEQKLLKPLLESYPEGMTNEELSQASGYANGSGGFNNPRGRLKTLGLIEYVSGTSRAKDFLFP